jgi:uncharacterized membrane protein (UPF0127 family)
MNKTIVLALILLVVGILVVLKPIPEPVFDELPKQQLVITTADGATHTLTVEVATTADQLRDGLMFRQKVAADAGMLFVFPQAQLTSFWMKNTLIPLDMLFIRADGSLAKIHANAQPHDETSISSGEAVKAVLEINGGRAQELGITTSSRLAGLPWLAAEAASP